MQLILRQLGDMLVAALPTAIVVFLFYLVLRWSFFAPITRVMKERTSRIAGAKREAESLHAEAEEKRRAHQEGLRKARAQIFAEQEAARRSALDERAATIQEARSRANEEVHAGRARVGAELEAARGELDGAGQQLAEEIVRSILQKPQPAICMRPPIQRRVLAGEVRNEDSSLAHDMLWLLVSPRRWQLFLPECEHAGRRTAPPTRRTRPWGCFFGG